ncbi:uncharacterized protein V6R79_024331 [Siganus canaliculatus]
MVRLTDGERSQISMDYVNAPAESTENDATTNFSGRKLYRLVAVSFGLLCILQAALNISLRLTLYSSDVKTDHEADGRNLTEELHELKRKIACFDDHSKQGWVYFQSSFYYISSTKKSWMDSRGDCLQRGADLIIINSKKEQDFTRNLHIPVWIGLTDREEEDTWKWVDGSPLTTSYWHPGEPNSYEGKDEDCVELTYHEENRWNDKPCEEQCFWICEKIMDFRSN